MQPHQETSDADFFSLVHHVLESHSPLSAERRENNRHDFLCEQFVSPYIGGRLPQQSDFRLVCCQDLSPSGFSYVEGQPPKCEFLIVALGDAPYIFVSAQVVRHRQIEVDGELRYLVGCRFVARITGVDYGHRLGVA